MAEDTFEIVSNTTCVDYIKAGDLQDQAEDSQKEDEGTSKEKKLMMK